MRFGVASIEIDALASHLEGDRRYTAICKLAKRCVALGSIEQDLKLAEVCLDQLIDVMADSAGTATELGEKLPQDPYLAVIGGALFNNAVVLYARATHSDPIDRFKFSIANDYDADLKAKHRQISKIRDHVVAHSGKGSADTGGAWIDTRLVLNISPVGSRFARTQVRYNYKAETAMVLEQLVRAALEIVQRKSAADENALLDALSLAVKVDEHFGQLLNKHRFDAVKFYERVPGALERYLAGNSDGAYTSVPRELTFRPPAPIPSGRSGVSKAGDSATADH